MLRAATGAECRTWMAKLDAAIASSSSAAAATAAVLAAANATNPHAGHSFRRSNGAQFECKVAGCGKTYFAQEELDHHQAKAHAAVSCFFLSLVDF